MDKWVEERQLQVHFVSAAGIVRKDDTILMLKSKRRGWEFPGGVLEEGEAILDCLKREIMEESGITIEPEHLTGVYQRTSQKPGYGPLEGLTIPTTVNFVFSCRYVEGKITVSDEGLEASWVTIDEAKERITSPFIRTCLEDMLSFDGRQSFGTFVEADGVPESPKTTKI